MMRTVEVQNPDRKTEGIECYLTYQGIREVKKETKGYPNAEIMNCWIIDSSKLMVELMYQGQLFVLWLPAYPRFLVLGVKRKTLSFQPRNRIPYYMQEKIIKFADIWKTNYGDTMRKLIDMGISLAEKEIKKESTIKE